MNISTFKTQCASCEQSFSTPLLPNMSYGVLLYHSTTEQSVRYFKALNHLVFEQVETVIEQNNPSAHQDKGTIIRLVTGRLADKPLKSGYFITDHICPHCGEKVQHMDPNEKTGFQEVKPLQFDNFRTLTELQQEKQIQIILANITHDLA